MSEPASPAFHLTDKVVILTGASSGLGQRFCQVLHQAGANLVIVARRADRLKQIAATVDGPNPENRRSWRSLAM